MHASNASNSCNQRYKVQNVNNIITTSRNRVCLTSLDENINHNFVIKRKKEIENYTVASMDWCIRSNGLQFNSRVKNTHVLHLFISHNIEKCILPP